jgi:hypothetical protein
MSFQLIASGGILDVDELSQYESYLDEGQRGLIELDLRLPVSQSIASELEDKLRQAGVEEVRVTTASPMLRIYFRKGFPWLAVIAAVILGIIVLAVLITGWRLFKEVVPEGWQPLVGGLGLVLLIGLGIAILSRRL